jgi:hypothetical protein
LEFASISDVVLAALEALEASRAEPYAPVSIRGR